MTKDELNSYIENNLVQPLWGNWYIKEKIGSGTFSTVYRVEAQRTSRVDVSALKIEPVVADERASIDEKRKMSFIEYRKKLVQNESDIMYRLKGCRNIVTYEEQDEREIIINGNFEGYLFLIRMEYLRSVSELIFKKQMVFSEQEVVKLAKDICQGLKAAHDIGVIHRDIKPDNFFVDENGVYKLGDFNVSKLSATAMTFAGTEGYIAPEVFRSKTDPTFVYSKQADIYSLGICLYQFMNKMYFPFEKEYHQEEAIDMRMRNVKLPPPMTASPNFAAIILKACEYYPEMRYQNVDELLYDLEHIYENTGQAQSFQRNAGADDYSTVLAEPDNNISQYGGYQSGHSLFERADDLNSYSQHNGYSNGPQKIENLNQYSYDPYGGAGYPSQPNYNSYPPPLPPKKKNYFLPLFMICMILIVVLSILVTIAVKNSDDDNYESSGVSATTAAIVTSEPETMVSDEEDDEEPDLVPSFKNAVSSSVLSPVSSNRVVYTYEAVKALDGDHSTAWSEGVNGAGTGENLKVYADKKQRVKKIKVYNGLCTSSDLFYKNNRVKECRLDFSDGSSKTVTLSGEFEQQPCEIVLDEAIDTKYIMFTIISVYDGSKYTDTLISDLEFEN